MMRDQAELSPYETGIGVELDAISETHARLILPYREANSNPGRVLHGGCAASLGISGGLLVARAALEASAGPFHTAGLQVNYLAAAIGEDVVASTRLLRRGRSLCFSETQVETREGKPVAHISSVVRGRAGAEPAKPVQAREDESGREPGPMGSKAIELPFINALGLEIEHMAEGRTRIVMPVSDKNADADGSIHEGAVIALLDTAGAMAPLSKTGMGASRASTPFLQARILAPPPRATLVACGRVTQQDGEFSFVDIEVSNAASAAVVALATVFYRIVM